MTAVEARGCAGTAEGTGPLRVTVAVPTYRRPDDLRVALPLLVDQARQVGARPSHVVDLLVVDNDPGRSGVSVVEELACPEVRYVAEPTPGIAAVRNRAMDEAVDSRLLAFIDDDERPLSGWLIALVDTWHRTQAVAIAGRVVPEYAGELDPWIQAGDFWFRRRRPTGTPMHVAAAGNLLLDLAQVRRFGVRFESSLGLGGGEDTLFSRALVRAGGRLVACEESVAVESVPLARMTRRWVLARAWSHGNTAVLTDLRLSSGRLARGVIRARFMAGGLARAGVGVARWAYGVLSGSPRHQARGLRAALRGAGMLAGSLGFVYEEYARSGRRWRLTRGGVR